MRTTKGLRKVDVIYRRIDDDFLDPNAFRADSLLGVPGLMDAYRAGNVALANAPGNGVADDKVVYAYVPDMIRYYEGEDPILPNVPTYLCWRDAGPPARAGESGQAGGESRQRSRRLRHAGRARTPPPSSARSSPPKSRPIRATTSRSRRSRSRASPLSCDDHFEGRHVDLRPYILYGKEIEVLPGGLTRVALAKARWS